MIDAPQGSAAWFAARCGKLGASRLHEAIAKLKNNGYAATRANVMADLIAERLTGAPTQHYVSAAMQWGIGTEAEACAAYAFVKDVDLEECGFFDHPDIAMTGASPDRLVGEHGLLEAKCPTSAVHIETLLGAPPADKYLAQVQWQMACTGRKWCDLVSYDPRMPEELRLHVEHVPRNDALIACLEAEVRLFLDEVDRKVSALAHRYALRVPGDSFVERFIANA